MLTWASVTICAQDGVWRTWKIKSTLANISHSFRTPLVCLRFLTIHLRLRLCSKINEQVINITWARNDENYTKNEIKDISTNYNAEILTESWFQQSESWCQQSENTNKHIYNNQGNSNTNWKFDDTDQLLLSLRAIIALWLFFKEISLPFDDTYTNTYVLNHMMNGVVLQNNGVETVSRAITETWLALSWKQLKFSVRYMAIYFILLYI